MAFSKGRESVQDQMILDRVSELDLAAMYLNLKSVPCVMSNPLRQDSHPSLGWMMSSFGRLLYRDFATNEQGTLISFLCNLFNTNREGLLGMIEKNIPAGSICRVNKTTPKCIVGKKKTQLQCRTRRWLKRDIEYWQSYGVPLKWLKWSEVYPVSNIIFVSGKDKYVFGADPLAYVFVEHKEDNTTLKIYQPYNKSGRKWITKNDKSVIGLWTKVPQSGDMICICSSLKDSLCLSANTGIPAIYIQGEGFRISKTACESLKSRYKHVYIMLDNDETGLKDGKKLADETGFENLVLPKVEGAKDISDIYHLWQDKNKFRDFMLNIFKLKQNENDHNCSSECKKRN